MFTKRIAVLAGIALATSGSVLGITTSAHAQANYTFTFTSGGTNATGNVSVTDNGAGTQFTAVSGSITLTGTAFDGIYPLIANPNAPASATFFIGQVGNSPTVTYDDQLFPSRNRPLDSNGLAFGTPGQFVANLFDSGNTPIYELFLDNNSSLLDVRGTGAFTPAQQGSGAVPEPGEWAFYGLAGAGLAVLVVKAHRKSVRR